MQTNVLLLPLDERPCNYVFPKLLAASSVNLVMPDRDRLGKKKQPADWRYVRDFLLQNAPNVDYAVISLDMLLYGGLLYGRLHQLTEADLAERLDVLRQIKRLNPKLTVYAFQPVMRCPQYSSDDEEPDYYGVSGREIFLLGEALDRKRAGLPVDAAAVESYRQKTKDCIDDYLARRAVNLALNLRAIDLVGDAIEYLVIPQDDSAPYGYTAVDQRAVRNYAAQTGKADRVAVYPGADELGLTLCCRAVLQSHGVSPRVYVTYSSDDGANCVPKYEDRPLGDSVVKQIAACGCTACRSADEADFVLAVHAKAGEMLEAERWRDAPDRNVEPLVARIAAYIETGKPVAVADVVFANGGDPALCAAIERAGLPFKLCAYGGWNTAGNTLGCVLAQAAVSTVFGKNDAFTALRYYEDLGYCTFGRRYRTDRLEGGCNYFDLSDSGPQVAARVRDEVTRFVGAVMPSVVERYRITACSMPWNRMFETELYVDVR